MSLALRFRVLGSGSGGNATLVEAAGTRILHDAGLTATIRESRGWDISAACGMLRTETEEA